MVGAILIGETDLEVNTSMHAYPDILELVSFAPNVNGVTSSLGMG